MRRDVLVVALAVIVLVPPAYADDVTVSGNVAFSALDGSVLDHDGVTNGIFTVNDGDLTVLGTVNCNDEGPGNASACAMRFAISGDLTIHAGGGLFAENRTGGGNGGNITLDVGQHLLLQGASASRPGAIISSGNEGNDGGGNIAFLVAGGATLGAGSIVSSASKGGKAGTIAIQANGRIDIDGLVASGPGKALSATVNTGVVLIGSGSSKQQGGAITIRSTSTAASLPGVRVGASGTIVSQGRHTGSGLVLLEGCALDVRGLVASVGDGGTGSAVTLRSGTTLVVDGRDRASLTGPRRGMLRADAPAADATSYRIRVLARDAIELFGPSGTLYALSSNPGHNNGGGGTIEVVSTGGTVTASGNVARAGDTANGVRGGRISVAAKGNIIAAMAVVRANGDGPEGAGGTIALRSHAGAVSWELGTGDVRPVGSGADVPAARQGTISLTYCTTLSTIGSSFPTDGSAPAFFPASTQTCSSPAPALPPGEPALPSCNDAPIATTDAYTVDEGGTLNAPPPGVLGNDIHAGGDPMAATLVSGPSHAASFSLNADGSFTYVHDGGETTSDSFTYRASNGPESSNVATVTIGVTPANDEPVANGDAYTIGEGGTLTISAPGVLGNDTDADSATLTAILVSGPAHGAFALNANGSFTYVHDGSETTSDTFTYRANDGSADSNVATVTITISPVNDAPVASDDSYTVDENGTRTAAAPGVLSNDTDAENATLTAVLVSAPAHTASFTLNADGSFTYVHDGGETSADTFTYRTDDGAAGSNVATVTITVAPVNDAPLAGDDTFSVGEGGTLSVAAPGALGNDTDADSATLTAVLVSGPAHAASFTLNADGSFSYVHDGGETTSDSFTYRANDGSLDSNIATVTVGIAPLNDPPSASNDAYDADEGGTLTVTVPSVLGNDSDPDGPALTAILVTSPAYASSFTLNPDGSFSYVHDGSETRSDSFTYQASDGSAQSNIATVTITVTPVNDAPVANDDAYGVDEGGTRNAPAPGILGNDADADGPALSAVLVSSPAHAASFTLDADGSFTYVHDGSDATSDTFTYRASDGALQSNVATVTIVITALNDPPVANADSYTVDEGGTLTPAAPGVLGNDTDPDGPILNAILVSGPSRASSFTLHPDGSFTYVHDGSETTADTFSYEASDGIADSNVATVTITVTPGNDPPTAFAFAGLPAQAGIRITYPAGKLGGTDVETGTTVTVDTTPINVVNGTVTLSPNGSFVFTPLPAAAGGMASFQYRVSDNGSPAPAANSAYVTVSFNVAGPAIYFTRGVPVGSANCTLGNECTVAGALASIGLAPNAHIFIGDAGTQTLASITLNPGGTIIGQGVQATSFDAFFGIVPPAQGTLAPRPPVNQQSARPTLATTVILNNNSHLRGFNLTPAGEGLVANGRSGLAVAQLNITSDANLPGSFCVNFVNSSGAFAFGNIAVNAGRNGSGVNFNGTTSTAAVTFSNITMGGSGNALVIASSGATAFFFQTVSSNSGRAVDISNATGQFVFNAINANGAATGVLVQNATGSFVVNGTNGNPGTGGTIQNCTEKGADFRASRNITLRGISFLNNATVDGPGASCGRIDLSTANNGPLHCNANLSLQSVTNVLFGGVTVSGSGQIGIDGQSVNGLTMQATTVTGNGNGPGEDGVQIANLTGTVTINVSNVFRDAAANLFEIVNDAGTLTASITASTFRNTTFPAATPGNSGLSIVGRGSAVVNPFVGSSTFQNINGAAVRIDLSGAASGLINVGGATHGITFTNNAQGIAISGAGTGAITYFIRENTLTNDPAVTSTFGTTAFRASFSGNATRTGTIENNTIGTNLLAALASGCFAAGCDGIQITDSAATGTHRVTLTNNRIFHVSGAAIRVTSGSGSAETLRARVTNNVANFPDNPASSAPGIVIEDLNATPNGVLMTCLDVAGNQISGLWAGGTSHKSAIGVLATRAQQFALTGFNPATEYAAGAVTVGCTTDCTGAAGLDGNAADFLSQQNPATVTAQALSGGSSASQQRLTASAPWTGTTGVCP